MIPKSRLPMPSARRMLRPALPKRWQVVAGAVNEPLHVSGAKKLRGPSLNNSSAVVVGNGAIELARIALPTRPSMPFNAPVGSAPLSGVNGAPL